MALYNTIACNLITLSRIFSTGFHTCTLYFLYVTIKIILKVTLKGCKKLLYPTFFVRLNDRNGYMKYIRAPFHMFSFSNKVQANRFSIYYELQVSLKHFMQRKICVCSVRRDVRFVENSCSDCISKAFKAGSKYKKKFKFITCNFSYLLLHRNLIIGYSWFQASQEKRRWHILGKTSWWIKKEKQAHGQTDRQSDEPSDG